MKITLKIVLFNFLLFSTNIFSQEIKKEAQAKIQQKKYGAVYTKKNELNLRGPVKSVCSNTAFNDSIKRSRILLLMAGKFNIAYKFDEIGNEITRTGISDFSEDTNTNLCDGLMINFKAVSLSSSYYKDYLRKKNTFLYDTFINPIYFEYFGIPINYKSKPLNKKNKEIIQNHYEPIYDKLLDRLESVNCYYYNNSNPRSYKEILKTLKKDDLAFVDSYTKYYYGFNNKINKITNSFEKHDYYIIRDKPNTITGLKMVLSGGNPNNPDYVDYIEKYTYYSSENLLYKKERKWRYQTSLPINFSTYHTIETYNKNEDIINIELVRDESDKKTYKETLYRELMPEGIYNDQNRYMEYIYDEHKNWIECHVYFYFDEENPKKGLHGMVVKRNIEYYTPEEIKKFIAENSN